MSANHTPGPWRLTVSPEYPSLVSIEMSNGKEVSYFAARSEPEEMANAHLIASAPTMFKALIDVLATLDANGRLAGLPKTRAALEFAIAKAEGRRE